MARVVTRLSAPSGIRPPPRSARILLSPAGVSKAQQAKIANKLKAIGAAEDSSGNDSDFADFSDADSDETRSESGDDDDDDDSDDSSTDDVDAATATKSRNAAGVSDPRLPDYAGILEKHDISAGKV
jgi:hypothetical protein